MVKTKKGALSIKVKCDDGSEKALHSLYDPEKEAEDIVGAFEFGGNGLLIVLGLGLGYHVAKLVHRFPGVEIVVVEASPEIYETAKEHGNISDLGERVRFIVGFSDSEVLKEIARLQMEAGMAPLSLFSLSSAISASPSYYNPIVASLKKTMSLRLWEKMRYPKLRDDRCKIALVDFDYFLTREVEWAMRGLGHDVFKVSVSKGEEGELIVSRVMNSLIEFKPDFFLTMNHLGFDEEGVLASFFNSIEMPVASWYVDSPNIIVKGFDKNVTPYVSLFLWDRGYMNDMARMGFESVTYLPLATDTRTFRPMQQKSIKGYAADVGFVGNSMVKPANEKLEKIPEEFHPMVDRLAKQLVGSRTSFDEALKSLNGEELECFKTLSLQERLDFEGAVLWKATLVYRLSCVDALKGFGTTIHGDRGWNELLNGSFRLKGQLNYYRELPLFYNACKINFNATSLQMGSAVNQRVFDVPACGGFLLTDQQEALDDLFDVGREIVTYRDKDEIPEIVRFYLNNPEKRDGIARKGRERVLREHTYVERISKVVQIMRERYS